MHPMRTFVVRLWIESTAEGNMQAVWRGHITRVISRAGRYVQTLDDINAYLRQQLSEMGVESADPAGGPSSTGD